MIVIKELTFLDILEINYLEFHKGLISIIGKSGSGKTSLIKCINLLNTPTTGDVLIEGESVFDIEPSVLRRKCLMLSQTPFVFEGSIKDNLLIGFSFKEEELPNESDLIEVLKKVKLDKDLNDDVSYLSGGEKQRLSLARILLMKSSIILLDEPFSGLNKELEEELIVILRDCIDKEDVLVLMVTHNEDLAFKYSNKVYRIESKTMKEVS